MENQKHVPVMLNTVIAEFESIYKMDSEKAYYILDCTLGQAGHSKVLFDRLKAGVLISIDLDISTIEWVSREYGFEKIVSEQFPFEYYQLVEGKKKWLLYNLDFSQIFNLEIAFGIENFDLILADLGFSNYQLKENIGISFDRHYQDLLMNYDKSSTKTAREILNNYTKEQLFRIFVEYGQIEDPRILVNDLINYRSMHSFAKVRDLSDIVTKSKYPKNLKVKVFQALRAYINQEPERLKQFLKIIPNVVSLKGKALIITFNSYEEEIVKRSFDTNLLEIERVQPNITEIISNPQSRSAVLYKFKKK